MFVNVEAFSFGTNEQLDRSTMYTVAALAHLRWIFSIDNPRSLLR